MPKALAAFPRAVKPLLFDRSELGLTAVYQLRFGSFHGAGWLAAHAEAAR
jgi:hypothetical protein